jgi:hypothetical protein
MLVKIALSEVSERVGSAISLFISRWVLAFRRTPEDLLGPLARIGKPDLWVRAERVAAQIALVSVKANPAPMPICGYTQPEAGGGFVEILEPPGRRTFEPGDAAGNSD